MKYKALFIHIPKTGGSSICTAPGLLIQGSINHDPALAIKDHNLKMCFTFVRDPYTRFTSAVMNHDFATPETFEEFVTTTFMENYEKEFEKWNLSEWGVLQPQHKYVTGNSDKKWDAIKFIGKFESLREDFDKVCEMLEIDYDLPHLNKNKFPKHVDCHTRKTKEIVSKVYRKDFEMFGYRV